MISENLGPVPRESVAELFLQFYATENTGTNLFIAAHDGKVGCHTKTFLSTDSIYGVASQLIFKCLVLMV